MSEQKTETRRCPIDHTYRATRTDGPTRCTWYPGTTEASPHTRVEHSRTPILDNILGAVGATPLVRLNAIPKEEGVEAEILVKCEYLSAGGSVKDRIGLRMIEDAERSGRIKPGDTLIEPTSGNTGIGLALAAAVKGYRMIITLPEKMSQEKVDVLKALGAQIIRTPTEAAFDSPESHIGVARRLNREIPNSHILDQYTNPSNPLAHYDDTAREILEACENKVDMLVVAAGTGGTLTGIARRFKEVVPECIIVGVDPQGSILAEPDSLNDEDRLKSYKVEGTGYDFIPAVLDRELVDRWEKTRDRESFIMARRLIRQEGILCGGSSGGNVAAALRAARVLRPGQRVVVILPDSVRNYMTKFLSDDWLAANDFVDAERGFGVAPSAGVGTWWASRTVADLSPKVPVTVTPAVTCKEAVEILAGEGFDQLPVVGADNNILGVVTEGNLSAKLMAGRVLPSASVTAVAFPQFRKVTSSTTLGDLGRVFDKDHFALVVATQKVFTSAGSEPEHRTIVSGVVTRIDLLRYITANAPEGAAAAGASP